MKGVIDVSTARIDFIKDPETGKYQPKVIEGRFEETRDQNKITKLENSQWCILINGPKIILKSFSQARKKKKNVFHMNRRNGSLFLYNSSTNWYWYWRNEKFQKQLDAYHIDKIEPCQKNEGDDIEFAEFLPIFDIVDGELVESKRYFTNKFSHVDPSDIVYLDIINRDEEEHMQFLVDIQVDNYLLVEERPGHFKLYINSKYTTKEAFSSIKKNNVKCGLLPLEPLKNELWGNV